MTREDFTAAVQQLQAAGQPITRNSIIRQLGGGSKSHAGAYLQELRGVQNMQEPDAIDALADALAQTEAATLDAVHEPMVRDQPALDALLHAAAPLPAAKAAFERILSEVQAHEALRPRQTTGLGWHDWYAQHVSLTAVCGQAEQRWRSLDLDAHTALQVLHVHRARYAQGRPRRHEDKRLADEAEATLRRLCGPLDDHQTLLDATSAALAPPRGPDGTPLLPPLI